MACARVLCALLVLCFAVGSFAVDHTVGDTAGWSTGVDYSTWTSGKTFAVGDNLVFQYGGGAHTVEEVSSSAYSSCSAVNSLSSDSSGATSIALKTPGPHYFICSVGGHCAGGMKLAVTVGGNGTTPTTPSGGNTPTPIPRTPGTPTTTIPSSSTTIYPSMAVVVTVFTVLRLSLS
ncbi:hypothetical protein IFM89_023698 [Coptis chinensis]|uniref:Phytocyanin domain-containing protein n=1 Tax=Coptis chinensis TaxID=261450 RepID=A0A835I608_9MAGN|nr:hypothetical protein IFM89_023698 [Coptis chinensis]